MNLIDAAMLGRDRLIELAKRDLLDRSVLWMALKGASRYIGAVVANDVASDNDATMRAMTCATCPELDRAKTSRDGVSAGYCGTGEVPGKTCGCLVTITIGISTRAAGKTIVESERCPQGKW